MVSRGQEIAIRETKKSIEREGRPITLVAESVVPLDPDHPSRGTTTIPQLPNIETFGVFTRRRNRRSNRGGIRREDYTTVVLVSAVGIDNAENVKYLIENDLRYGVSLIEPVQPGTTPIVYKYALEG